MPSGKRPVCAKGVRKLARRIMYLTVAWVLGLVFLSGCHPNSVDEYRQQSEDSPLRLTATTQSKGNPLRIVESGWILPQGKHSFSSNVHFGVVLQNTSEWEVVRSAAVRVMGIDREGLLLFDSRISVPAVFANETVYLGGKALANLSKEDGEGLQVLFAVENDAGELLALFEEDPSREGAGEFDLEAVSFPEGAYEISEIAIDQYAREAWTFEGGVTLADGESMDETVIGEAKASSVCLSLILRDDDGEIVYGDAVFVDGLIEGEPAEFAFDCILPFEYATYEVHARPWTPGATLLADPLLP